MRIDHLESRRLQERFKSRAKVVFYCRLGFYALGLLSVLFYGSWREEFLLFCLFLIGYSSFQVLEHRRFGRWAIYASLCADVAFLATLLTQHGGIKGPAMLIQPIYVMFYTLIFPNPLVAVPALLLLPYGVFQSALLTPDTPFSTELLYLATYGCLNVGIMYLMNWSIATEEEQTREVISLERRLRSMSVLEERNRIAREIHDGVGAALSGLIIQAEYLTMLSPPDSAAHQESKELKLSAENAIDEVRRAISMMRDDFDLVYQLENTCKLFETRHKIPVHLSIDGPVPGLKPQSQLTLFRVMQECLTNIAKHAHAFQVWVDVVFHGAGYHLKVKDDGCGFEVGHTPQAHYGLTSMVERAEKIGAMISIHSKPQQGTTIELSFN